MDEKKWIYDFRVAYKRLIKMYDSDTEEYYNSVVWLGKLSRARLLHIKSIEDKKKNNEPITQEEIEALKSTFDFVRYFYRNSLF